MLHYRLHRDPASSHQQISQLLRQLRPKAILDVGAAQGFLGQLLQESGLVLDAVEPQPQWAEHARPFYRRVFASTVEQAALEPGAYDAIVCADVIEHVPDPAGVLAQLRRAAAPDATFIVSVPNVAHLAVRLMLLCGRFPPMDRGILDRTHLHFYTKDTAGNLLRSAGLTVERISAAGVPLDEVFKRGEGRWWVRVLAWKQRVLVHLLPRLFAMQWIFVARNTR